MNTMKYIFTILTILFSSCKETSKEIILNQQISPIADKNHVGKPNEVDAKLLLNTDFILGKFDYKNDTTFTKVKSNHSSKLIYLKKEVYSSFENMHNQAQKDGIRLIIISGTRNFYEQKSIWERKWNKHKNLEPLERAKKILEYSSMPSSSRHHWGTDLDINNLNNSYFESGTGKKEYDWLQKNANNFGFFQVYSSKDNGRTGYNEEKWHWSYLPLASSYLNYYNQNIEYKDITGFKGSEIAEKAKIISKYVNGISKRAQQFE